MPEAFDPYYQWLGIPPSAQPADHYRLLGLQLFEENADVIDSGAERQTVFLRNYQIGKYSDFSQKLLNEIAAAKICLLNPAKKAAYDAKLRCKLSAPAVAAAPANPAPVNLAPAGAASAPTRPPVPPVPKPGRAALLSKQDVSLTPPSSRDEDRKHSGELRSDEIPTAVATHDDSVAMVPTPVLTPSVPESIPRIRLSMPMWLTLGMGIGALLVGGLSVWLLSRTAHSSRLMPVERRVDNAVVSSPLKPVVFARRPPKLAALADQTVHEGEALRVPVLLADPGTAGGKFHYSLDPNAPEGVAIDADTGVLTWEPRRAGKFSIPVRVADADKLTDQTSLRVEVQHIYQSPSIRPLDPQDIAAGKSAMIVVTASDPDTPFDKLRFSLIGAPDWVRIDVASGVVTCTPADDMARRTCLVTIRVTDDSPTPLFDETTLVIRVSPPEPPAAVTDYRITFPSGKLLSSIDFDILKVVKDNAEVLRKACAAQLANALPLWSDRTQTMIAAFTWVKGEAPNGNAVFFYPGKDPLTCYARELRRHELNTTSGPAPSVRHRGPLGVGTIPSAPRVDPSTLSFWDDVVVKLCVDYEGGKWRKLAAWDEQGAKQFFGSYSKGQRDGLCCLFQNDQLRAVLECTAGSIDAVHLIAGGKIQKTFADLKQAQEDIAAKAMLEEIDKTESALVSEDHQFIKSVKTILHARVAEITAQKRAAATARIRAHQQQNQQNMEGVMKSVPH
jgi:hypothetical protein